MATLHILNQSPFTSQIVNNCFLFLNDEDAILLTGDAVYALQKDTSIHNKLLLQKTIKYFALEEDIQARAIQTQDTHVTIINYQGFVSLCTEYTKLTSWL